MRRIALLTDFGTRDPYVAAMKGVIAARTEAAIVDLSHEIAPYDILEAAWFLRTAAPWWPEQTIFVAVVDPGVGSERRILAAQEDGRVFLAPDNGLLTLVLTRSATVVSIENAAWFLLDGSNTFHGRDRFAPVAAAIANGTPIDDLGPRMLSIVRLEYQPPVYGEVTRGTIVAVDRFGNLITDIERTRIPHQRFALRAGGVTIDRIEPNYAHSRPGVFLIVGSSGLIEVSVRNGSAAEQMKMKPLDAVEIHCL